jgi:hypothetical protein
LFGLDNGAVVGFEFRFGVAAGWQAGIYRTSDRTIEFFTQYDLGQQAAARPVGLGALVAIEGRENLTETYSPSIGLVISRALGDRVALYAQPIWVGGTNLVSQSSRSHSTFAVGLGARLRMSRSSYLVGEIVPRAAGYREDSMTYASFGYEGRVGGHVFQLNVSNGFGTTLAQLARGVHSHSGTHWYLGFNLSRKFY